MHELGHNLNLFHGGNENVNRKPNYLSVMSYSFQTRGIPPMDPDGPGPLMARVDYSPADLADLDENNLDEPTGIGDGTDTTRYMCPPGERLGAGTGPIDWNCDGDTTDTGIAVNLNGGTFGVLTGFDDWANLKFDFQNTGDFEDGEHSFSIQVVEIDFPTHLEMPEVVAIDIAPDEFPNLIHPDSQEVISVAILTTDSFDASAVDPVSIRFGPHEAMEIHGQGHLEDIDGDGDDDLVLHFNTQDTGIQCGHTSASLTGETIDGDAIQGSDAIITVGGASGLQCP
jgi:hypothetical protein